MSQFSSYEFFSEQLFRKLISCGSGEQSLQWPDARRSKDTRRLQVVLREVLA